jgi:hypothetical protein
LKTLFYYKFSYATTQAQELPPPNALHILTVGGGRVAANGSAARGNSCCTWHQRSTAKNRSWKDSLNVWIFLTWAIAYKLA